jgi:hypothetical protein
MVLVDYIGIFLHVTILLATYCINNKKENLNNDGYQYIKPISTKQTITSRSSQAIEH